MRLLKSLMEGDQRAAIQQDSLDGAECYIETSECHPPSLLLIPTRAFLIQIAQYFLVCPEDPGEFPCECLSPIFRATRQDHRVLINHVDHQLRPRLPAELRQDVGWQAHLGLVGDDPFADLVYRCHCAALLPKGAAIGADTAN